MSKQTDHEDIASEIEAAAFKDAAIEYVPIGDLKPYERNARTHSESQITVIAASIEQFGFRNPVLIDGDNVIIAGHGRVEAAKRLGLEELPAIRIEDLTDDQIRAYRLADNRLAELSGWDDELLKIEFEHLVVDDVGLVETTGFTLPEVDILLEGVEKKGGGEDEAADEIPPLAEAAISRLGDLWLFGEKHRLLCGSALVPANYDLLLDGHEADMVFQDPPWNCRVSSISGSGATKHREFVMASGELTEDQFRAFLADQLAANADHACEGAVVLVFIDWRGVEKVIAAGASVGLELINVCVWYKGHGSFGSPWRSAHELVVAFRKPGAPIKDRVKLGKYGRVRNNVWECPGMGSFGKGRMEALSMHPTSKPVALLAEAIRDVTDIGDIVLDSFMGSGSCLIAAHKTGRIAYGMELDPLYVDTIVRRWEKYTGEPAVLAGDGRTFAEVAEARMDSGLAPVRRRTRIADNAVDAADIEEAADVE